MHKRGWRSHTLTVLLILSIPMAWAARCVLSTCVQKAHTPTFGRAVQILSLSDIYIQRNYHCCYRSQSYGVSGTQQESDQTGICASMVASGFARPFPTVVCPTRPLQQLRVSCQQYAACHMLSRLVPHLTCAEPSSNLYRSCHGSLTLPATCFFGSYRASPAPSHLLKFIARVMPAMRCLPLAFSAHAAPRLR